MTKQYKDLLRKILEEGTIKTDRTGTGTKSVFGYQMRFDLQKGFPLLTTKRVAFGLIKSELLWFLHGDTNIKYLLEHNNHIWDEWAFERYVSSPKYIDLEGDAKKAWRVRERFLSAEELQRLSTPAEVLAAWCAKEATYKLCDVEGFRFMDDMQCGAIEKGQLRMKLPSVGKDAMVGLSEVEQLCFALSQWRKP